MTFSAFVELVSDKHENLGKLSDLYADLFGLLFTKDTGKLFKWYKKWEFKKDDEDIESLLKTIFLIDKNEKYYLFFNSFSDLVQAFSEFEDPLYYLQNYPSKKYLKNITAFEWGNYHLKFIYNQYYVIKERIIKFIRTIEKIARKEGDKRFSKISGLEKGVVSYFAPLLGKRHELVHERAFMDERLLLINARGSRLIKMRKSKQRSFKISEELDVQRKIKADLYTKSIEIEKELNSIIGFLNTRFADLSEIVGDWYEDWDREYRGQV